MQLIKTKIERAKELGRLSAAQEKDPKLTIENRMIP